MRKGWKDAGGAAISRSLAPPRVDKGKGWVHAPDAAMEVDVDAGRGGLATSSDTQQRSHSMHAPPPPPPSFHSLLPPSVLAPGAAARPSPSTSFARLSLQDVEMPDVVPLVVVEPPTSPLDEVQPQEMTAPLSLTAFVATMNQHSLSPLAVPSVVHHEPTLPPPSPPPAVGAPPAATVPSPSPPSPAPLPPSLSPPLRPAVGSLFSEGAAVPLSFVHNNGVSRPSPSFTKPFPQVSPLFPQASPSFGMNRYRSPPRARGSPPSPPARNPSPAQFRFLAPAPSQEEGEILPNSSPPHSVGWRGRFGPQPTPRTSPFDTPTAPPTQPRSHQLQRMPPSAPKALREAQNANAIGLGIASGSGGSARGGALRFNGMGPQTMPSNILEPMPRSGRRGGWKKHQRSRGR
ncbi:hypothetical protein K438DRAFT_1985260 [Mycena galopus ATCC 62051]|nr:hypothetical protein K438DRAFT_1985260 [Mycena galopus ATCC 62051]